MPSSRRFPAFAVIAMLATAGTLAACGTAETPETGTATGGSPSDAPSVTATTPSTGTTQPEAETSASSDASEVPEELNFTADTVDGATFDGRSIAGRDAVVYFWAPWCPICRREAPGLASVVADFPDLTFVTVGGSSQDRDAMAGFVDDVGFGAFPNVADESGEVWTRFGVTYQYTYAFVDDTGIVELVTGPLDEADLRSRIDALLAS